jgi:hypothetical protein
VQRSYYVENVNEESESEIVKTFLASRRSEVTIRNYERDLKMVLGDSAEFLKLARADPFTAKMQLMSF